MSGVMERLVDKKNALVEKVERLQAENAKLRDALKRLLDFARRRLPTGNIPPQGEAAMRLLAELGGSEYVALIPQLDAYRADFPKETDHG